MDNSFTPYDDAFRTMITDAPITLIPLINEMFKESGIHLLGKEKLNLSANEIFLNQQNGEQAKRITDSSFTISDGEHVRRFHIECQSTTDGTMVIRMFEYDAQIALNDARNTSDTEHLVVNFPESGILYLRSNEDTPKYVTTTIKVPGGQQVTYKIPTLSISSYSAEDIIDKKLYFLIPFYIFNYEKTFDDIIKGNEAISAKMISDYKLIAGSLQKALKDEELKELDIIAISGMFKKVMEHLTVGHEIVRKEVLDNMGGTVLDYPAKTAYNEGLTEGARSGVAQMRIRAVQKIMEKYNVSLEEACDACDSTVEEYYEAVELLKNEDEAEFM